jgi:hypothetical protein
MSGQMKDKSGELVNRLTEALLRRGHQNRLAEVVRDDAGKLVPNKVTGRYI